MKKRSFQRKKKEKKNIYQNRSILRKNIGEQTLNKYVYRQTVQHPPLESRLKKQRKRN